MAVAGDEDLAALIVREQRGFRRILYAGLVTLLLMAVMSAALGVYLYVASQTLEETSERLQKNAFDTRRRVDAQNNRLVAQDIAIRRAYDEIRRAGDTGISGPNAQTLQVARDAARNFLLRGRIPNLAEQRALTWFGGSTPEGEAKNLSPGEAALLNGVYTLVDYDGRDEAIPAGAAELPPALIAAMGSFQNALHDPSMAPLANAGIAWIKFEDASSARKNYSSEACEEVFSAVSAASQDGTASAQPLYWRAQCERKLGRASDALGDYARALRASMAITASQGGRSDAELTLAMNAYHGVGTTLIASAATPDNAPGMADALAIAGQACTANPDYANRSPRMALALSCLDEAIALRRALGQTDNQLSGTGENVSFAHLRDGDYNAAFANASKVERTGLFAWNELVRAMSASHATFADANERRAAQIAGADARRNVSMFGIGQFNVCEIKALLNEDMYADVSELLAQTHPHEDVACKAK